MYLGKMQEGDVVVEVQRNSEGKGLVRGWKLMAEKL